MRLGFVMMALAVASMAFADVQRGFVRVGPGDTWCPTGITVDSVDPNENLDAVSFNQGVYEISFTAPVGGRVRIWLGANRASASMPSRIDNVMLVEREELFSPSANSFGSSTCHKSSNPDFPTVRVPIFDYVTGIPSWMPFARSFKDPEPTWTFVNAAIDPEWSATTGVALDAEDDITWRCEPPTPCSTGVLELGVTPEQESYASFTVGGLTGGTDYVLLFWWNIEKTETITVRVEFRPILVDAFESGDTSGWSSQVP